MAVASAGGALVIFGIGVSYLYLNLNYIVHKEVSWAQALWSGVIVFLPGELVKLIMAAVLLKRLKPIIHGDCL